MKKCLPIMIQGTCSDSGKSILATAFCRIFSQDGYRTAPFKSQNMALNSYVTLDGKEIGRAQGIQAEAAGIAATTDMNPILIKPTRDMESQVILNGKPFQNMKASRYRSEFYTIGLSAIKEAYQRLTENFERIVIEGAGSPAEINLNDREMVNMRVARLANAPVVLVADIDRGGVFASLVGTLQLLDPIDRERVIGVIINKFRGDLSLLQPGLDWFEEYTGKPVLGVVPFIPDLYIDAEDSLSLEKYTSKPNIDKKEIDIAVIRYPRISNFTDIDPFLIEDDCHVRMVKKPEELGKPDLVILPGSKNTIEDLMYLRENGLEKQLFDLKAKKQSYFFGICGGYQMLGSAILDPYHVESPNEKCEGLKLLPIKTTLTKKKTTVFSTGEVKFSKKMIDVKGYEIHMGQSKRLDDTPSFIQLENHQDGCFDLKNKVIGTYFHGIFHNDEFRHEFLNLIRMEKGFEPLENRISFKDISEDSFNRLATVVRKHVRIDDIKRKMEEFQASSIDVS
ncbi:cobyric acid synthase [Fictibacillus sp. Mic-4]|uniref:cobyric acid synthase n=1 Tax=Fictibacillus sp. Mic-4 TaxID=3132826 RepID=UPI003CED54ED